MKKIFLIALILITFLGLASCSETTDIDNPVLSEVSASDIAKLEETASTIDGLYIGLLDNSIITNSTNVVIQSNVVTIKSGGTYTLFGTLNNGQIIVDINDEIQLNLDNISIHNASGAAILVEDADGGITINLVEGSVNTLSDGSIHNDEDITGVLHSKDNLTIEGLGTLSVSANYLDGIVSKNSLTIMNGIYNITASGDACYGKDNLTILDGEFNISAGGGSALAPVIEETINQGPIGRPGLPITTETDLEDDENSSKGLKSQGTITINDGTYTIDTYDDAIHSDTEIIINGGSFSIKSGDDAIHADNQLTVTNGEISVLYSCEGFESFNIIIENGEIYIYAYDDGMNATNGTNTSVGGPGDTPDYSDYDEETTPIIEINGGNIVVKSDGDGIDANGVVIINGGNIYVNGKGTTSGMIESPIDFDITGIVNGGTILATGTSSMAYSFDPVDSLQNSFNVTFNTFYSSGTEIKILDSNSNIIGSMITLNNFETLIFSSDELTKGNTYTLIIGDDIYNYTLP